MNEPRTYTMKDIGTYDEEDGKYYLCRYVITPEHLEALKALELAVPTGPGLERFRFPIQLDLFDESTPVIAF